MNRILLVFLTGIMLSATMSASGQCGTNNIALNKTVSVSSEVEWHEGYSAVDGNPSTAWFTTSGDVHYLQVDLGQSYTICRVALYWTSNGRGKDYKIQVSDDASNWTDISTRTNNSNTTDDFTASGTGRYIRLGMTARVFTWANYELTEFEIYHTTGNTPPAVSLTAPASNAGFTAPATVNITATASDADGTVSKVEFYNGSQLLGDDQNAPFNYTWNNVQAGSYTLTAKAYDNLNAPTTSSPVNIMVSTGGGNAWLLAGNSSTTETNFLGTTDDKPLILKTNNINRIAVLSDGFVGIGTSVAPHAEAKLGVNGAIYAKKLKVTQNGWADFVFNKDYKLPTLQEVEEYINQHNHLPGVPSEAEVKRNGTDVAEIQTTLLKKIEELTLYIIEQNKKIEAQQKQIDALRKQTNHNK